MISLTVKVTFTIVAAILCLTSSIILPAQSITFRFQSVIVGEKLEPIGGAYIKNIRTNKFVTTNASGSFSIECRINDSLLITAMGYELEKIYVEERNITYIQLHYLLFKLEQVNVYDFKGWDAFRNEFLETEIPGEKVNIRGLPKGRPSQKPIPLRSNTFNRKPTPFHFIRHPFSSLAYFLNEDEKSKRQVWNLMKLENKEMAYWKVMNSDSIQSWINIPDSTINEFIFYCNTKIENKGLGATYYYKEKIIDLYPVFLEKKSKK